jgi:transient receptor potential cation channel subfamily V member 6
VRTIFKSEVLATVTDLHWQWYGSAGHIRSLLMYLTLLALFILLLVYFDAWVTSSNKQLKQLAWSLQIVKCLITASFVRQEMQELHYKKFRRYVFDIWNVMDTAAYSLLYTGVGIHYSNREHPAQSKAANLVHASAAVLMWLKLLHYMRPYQATGHLVAIIFKVLLKIRAFMLVLVIVVLGFASAFYAMLSNTESNKPLSYSHPDMAVRTAFAYMLGTYELSVLDAGPSQVMLSILWVIFCVIVPILLLNLLIAVMSEQFSRHYETGEHSYRMEKS